MFRVRVGVMKLRQRFRQGLKKNAEHGHMQCARVKELVDIADKKIASTGIHTHLLGRNMFFISCSLSSLLIPPSSLHSVSLLFHLLAIFFSNFASSFDSKEKEV